MTPSPSLQKNHLGFTLAEILIALGIIALGVVSVLGVFAMAKRMERQKNEEQMATRLAQLLETELRIPNTITPSKNTSSSSPKDLILSEILPIDEMNLGSRQKPLVLAFDGEANSLPLPPSSAATAWEQGVSQSDQIQYLLGFWGEQTSTGVIEFQIRVEVPARAEKQHRRSYSYWFSVLPTR